MLKHMNINAIVCFRHILKEKPNFVVLFFSIFNDFIDNSKRFKSRSSWQSSELVTTKNFVLNENFCQAIVEKSNHRFSSSFQKSNWAGIVEVTFPFFGFRNRIYVSFPPRRRNVVKK